MSCVAATVLSVSLCMTLTAKTKRDSIPVRTPFSNAALSLDISTWGAGISAATPVHKNFYLKLSYTALPVFVRTPMSETGFPLAVLPGNKIIEMPAPDTRTALNSHIVRLTADWVPGNEGRSVFYVSGGILFQNSKFLWSTEEYDTDLLKEFGLSDAEINDVHIINDYGEYILGNDSKVESSLHRPNFGLYLGVGLGRPIPKRRVGFRVELGFPIFVGRTARHTDGWVSGNALTILIPLWGKSVENRSVFISPVLSFHVTFKLYNDNIRRKTAETD